MRRRGPDEPGRSELPPRLAAGPDPTLWAAADGSDGAARAAWRAAGEKWSVAHGLGRGGWLDLLDPAVRSAVSALGRAAIRHGGRIPPWLDPDRRNLSDGGVR